MLLCRCGYLRAYYKSDRVLRDLLVDHMQYEKFKRMKVSGKYYQCYLHDSVKSRNGNESLARCVFKKYGNFLEKAGYKINTNRSVHKMRG